MCTVVVKGQAGGKTIQKSTSTVTVENSQNVNLVPQVQEMLLELCIKYSDVTGVKYLSGNNKTNKKKLISAEEHNKAAPQSTRRWE